MIAVERFSGTAEEWDGFASRQEGFTHFHRLGWRTLMADVLGHECLYLAARADGDEGRALEGILPLVRVRSVIFGHYLVSMPFLNYGGPLGTARAVRALVDEASRLAERDGARLLELRSRVPLSLAIPASHRKITVLLDLPGTAPLLQQRLGAKLRSQVKRPVREGVRLRFGADQVDSFHHVFARHMHDLGTPAHSLEFFRHIVEQFPDDCWVACAYLGHQPVACGCGFRFGDELEMTWASSLRAFNRLAPNMLLYWGFMERAIQDGVKVFNFGRCTPGGSTHRFKTQWGGRDEALWWYDVAPRGGAPATTPSPRDGAFDWGPSVWRRLPVRLTTAIGPSIVRLIP